MTDDLINMLIIVHETLASELEEKAMTLGEQRREAFSVLMSLSCAHARVAARLTERKEAK